MPPLADGLEKLVKALVPPGSDQPTDDTRRARILLATSIVFLPSALVVGPAYLAVLGNPWFSLHVSMACLIAGMSPLILRWTRSFHLATWVLCGAVLAVLPVVAWNMGGLASGTYAFVGPIAFLALLTTGPRTAAQVFAVGTLEMAVTAVGHLLDLLPPSLLEGNLMAGAGAIVWTTFAGTIVVIGAMNERDRRRALDELSQTFDAMREESRRHQQTRDRLAAALKERVDSARLAGRAEVATAVLHDVGNALTAANVSVALVRRHLAERRRPRLGRVADHLRGTSEQTGLIGAEGRARLADYLDVVAAQAEKDHEALQAEVQSLATAIDHVASVIRMQQAHARAPDLPEPIEISVLVDEVSAYLRASFASRGIRLETRRPALAPVVLNRHRVVQILTNLLTNARDAVTGASVVNPRVSLIASVRGDRLRFDVIDNGPGVPKEHRDRLFQHGFTTKPSGSGVGLHASANLARTMDGVVTLEPDPEGGGAHFSLVLPLDFASREWPAPAPERA